jgi:hypothetical protein
MKVHDCYLANWTWLEGRDNQDNLATWHEMFLEKSIPSLNFITKLSLDARTLMCECDSMLHDDWLDIPCIIILHSFCFKLGMVSDKNTRRNIFTIIFLCSFHKGITTKGGSSCYLPKVLVLGQKLILGKRSNYTLSWWSGFPSNINLYVPVSRSMPTIQWDL